MGSPVTGFKISVQRDRDFVFGTVGGILQGAPYADAISVRAELDGESEIASLIVLEQTSCNALTAGGVGSADSGFYVSNRPPDALAPQGSPGTIAVDSDGWGGSGSDNCNTGTRYTIDNGQAWIWAEGEIGSYALGPNGQASKAHAPPNGKLGVEINPRNNRIGRKSVDWLFNCRRTAVGGYPDYDTSGNQRYPFYGDVPACEPTENDGLPLDRPAYIDEMRLIIGLAALRRGLRRSTTATRQSTSWALASSGTTCPARPVRR
jgi:hypothetical protein